MRIIVEGWRFIFHSYCIANQFQLLEMLKRSDLELFHRDMPYIDKAWKTPASLSEPTTQALRMIPSPSPNQSADVTLRMYCPWDFTSSTSTQTWVFAATEWGVVMKNVLRGIGVSSLTETSVNSEVMMMTPSHWSKVGLIRSGVQADRIAVVPLGVDTNLYKPLTHEQRIALRKKLGWEDYFVFLNIGGCTNRKGIRPLLKAFAATVERYPQARLVLKGSDLLYPSKEEIAKASQAILTEAERAKVGPRLAYTGKHLSVAEVIQFYQAADTYVSPYLAEGFNLPVLEAIACGLPVICTKGGPTDDFTHPDFALAIESQCKPFQIEGQNALMLYPNQEHLTTLMQTAIEQPSFATQARHAGPSFVAHRFTWKQVVDQLLDTIAPSKTRVTIDRPA